MTTTTTLTIPLRSSKHAQLVLDATAGVPAGAVELGADGEREALLVHGHRTEVLEAVAAAIPTLKAVYDSRLMTATYVMLRQRDRDLPAIRTGRIARVVTGLNEARVDWAVRFRLDGTLDWFVGTSTDPVPLKALVDRYAADTGYKTKAKAPKPAPAVEPSTEPAKAAKKAPARKAPATKKADPAKVEQARALAAKKAGRPAPKNVDVTPIPKTSARKPRATKKAS